MALGYSTIHPDETGYSACRALIAAVRYYAGFGITIRRVLTDNGSCYKSRRFKRLCRRLGIRHAHGVIVVPVAAHQQPKREQRHQRYAGLLAARACGSQVFRNDLYCEYACGETCRKLQRICIRAM